MEINASGAWGIASNSSISDGRSHLTCTVFDYRDGAAALVERPAKLVRVTRILLMIERATLQSGLFPDDSAAPVFVASGERTRPLQFAYRSEPAQTRMLCHRRTWFPIPEIATNHEMAAIRLDALVTSRHID